MAVILSIADRGLSPKGLLLPRRDTATRHATIEKGAAPALFEGRAALHAFQHVRPVGRHERGVVLVSAAERWPLSGAVGGTDDVATRRNHEVVENLRKHACREKGDRPEGLFTGIDEIVPVVRVQDEDATRADGKDSIVAMKLAGAGKDVLRLLSLVGVPSEPVPWLDLKDNSRRLLRALPAVRDKDTGPSDRLVALPMNANEV
jgi:hypothetical protein